MEQLTATRSELLARRARLELARRGRDLLEDKRDQLLEEFRKTAGQALTGEDALERAVGDARSALAWAEAIDGPDAIRSAALAGRSSISLYTRVATVMGVRIADIQSPSLGRSRVERGTAMTGTSPYVDQVAERFEVALELLIEHANHELRLRRLAEEIATTTRRVNALEFVVVPRLEREAAQIQSTLDERERQDRFRLKRIKERKARQVSP